MSIEDPVLDSSDPHGREPGHSKSLEPRHTVEYYVQSTGYLQTSSAARSLITDDQFCIMESVLHSMQALHKVGQGGLEFRPNLVVLTGRKEARLTQRNDKQLDDNFIKHNHHQAVRSVLYTAPEVLRGLKSDDIASIQMADIWSFACLCLYIVSRRDPEYCRTDRQGKKRLVNGDCNAFVTLTLTIGERKYLPEYSSYCEDNSALESLFRDCFQFDPTKRPTAITLRDSVLPACKPRIHFRVVGCIASPLGNICQTSVYKAIHGRTGEVIAVKIIMLAGEGSKAEIQSLTKKLTPILGLHHANVVRHDHIQEMLDQRQLAECGLPKQLEYPQYQILMEYCLGGTLHDYVNKSQIAALLLQHWTRQLVEGLSYLYEQNCVHRDIKGQNIFLSSEAINTCNLKIGDLGDLKRLLQNFTHPREVSHDKGTYAFMSPEMINGEENPATRVGRRTDIWSLGCVIIQMITGQVPRFVKTTQKGQILVKEEMAVMYFVAKGGSPTIPEGLPKPVEDFVRVCLTRNADERPYAPELKTHPFLTSAEAGQWALPERLLK